MKKIRKKGFIASALTDFYAWLGYIFIIIIFFFLFKFTGANLYLLIGTETGDINAKTSLLNFVRTPVEFDIDNDNIKESLTIGELIVFTDITDEDSETYKLLKEKIVWVLDILWHGQKSRICGLEMNIIKGKEEKTISYRRVRLDYGVLRIEEKKTCYGNAIGEGTVFIPVPEGNEEKVKVNLRIVGGSGTPGIERK